jgi:glycosyltransferase involved in cell wall biosynthesis
VRIAIFSPMGSASAIARVTQIVTAALVEAGNEVVIVRSEDEEWLKAPARTTDARVIAWNDEHVVRKELQRSDGIVYQVGDNYPFHRGCLEWLNRAPGIVCLHDYFVGHLFRWWAVGHRREADRILRTWYGSDVAAAYFAYGNATFIEQTAETAPMTEWIASMALGVLTHSSWSIDRVLSSCPGPVQVAGLPFEAPTVVEGSTPGRPKRDGDFTVLTVGHMNANKRIESVIRAIASSERLRERTTYRLVGPIDPDVQDRLSSSSDQLGVKLSIEGLVGDADLRAALDEADVVCCIRRPTLEAASASAIEAMLHRKPVIVMDAGFYAELPDDCVAKVSPEHEVEGIARALEAFESDPAARLAIGRRAFAYASETFRADRYATNLVELCRRVAVAAPVIEATRYYADVLARWGVAGTSAGSAPDTLEPLRIFDLTPRALP